MTPQQPQSVEKILLKYLRSHRVMQGLPVPPTEYGVREDDDNWLLPEATTAIKKLLLEERIEELVELVAVLNDVVFRSDTPKVAKPALKSVKVDLEARIKELERLG